jgi:O-6-methylguanine DNA methyltransferase
MLHAHLFMTPLGSMLSIVDETGALTKLHFGEPASLPAGCAWSERGSRDVVAQVGAYFDGTLRSFDLRLAPAGTAFQQRVWQELLRIPFGMTISYAELARRVGREGAARAVGQANGANPIALVVPCHRVIAASGAIAGYAGGVSIKEALLRHEGGAAAVAQTALFA